MTIYDETAGMVFLAVSFVVLFLPMSSLWLWHRGRRVHKREVALDSAHRTAEAQLAEARIRLETLKDHADISTLERRAILEMLRIVTDDVRGGRR